MVRALGGARVASVALCTLIFTLAACSGGGDVDPTLPTASPEPTLTNEELVAVAQATFQSYQDELVLMYEQFDYDYTRLLPYATEQLASQNVADMQSAHSNGYTFSGSVIVTNVELSSRAEDTVEAAVCLDATATQIFDVASGEEIEPTSTQVTAWTVAFTSGPHDTLLVDRQERSSKPETCGS